MSGNHIHRFTQAVIPLFENCEFCGERILCRKTVFEKYNTKLHSIPLINAPSVWSFATSNAVKQPIPFFLVREDQITEEIKNFYFKHFL